MGIYSFNEVIDMKNIINWFYIFGYPTPGASFTEYLSYHIQDYNR